MSKTTIHVDISRLNGLMNDMRSIFTQKEFELLMARAFMRTARNVKKILQEEIPKEYHAKKRWIGQSVKAPRVSFGGFTREPVSCTIPIEGPRGTLGRRFKASWPPGRRVKGKKYRITVDVVKNHRGRLPEVSPRQGKQPYFISPGRKNPVTKDTAKYIRDSKGRFAKGNISGNIKGIVFTRSGKARYPIVSVSARAVAQMAADKAEKPIQDRIVGELKGNMEREYNVMLGRIKTGRR